MYGHFIPWRIKNQSRDTNIRKQIDEPHITLSLKRIRFNALQANLFHGELYNVKPRVVHSNISKFKLMKQQ